MGRKTAQSRMNVLQQYQDDVGQRGVMMVGGCSNRDIGHYLMTEILPIMFSLSDSIT